MYAKNIALERLSKINVSEGSDCKGSIESSLPRIVRLIIGFLNQKIGI